MSQIQLIALDLDGTLFNHQGQITSHTLETIKKATTAGVHVVISTGRPFCGLPLEQIEGSGIQYAITANGAAIYDLNTNKCVAESPMETELITPIIDFLLTKEIHMDAFIEGDGFSPASRLSIAKKLDIPESLKKYIIGTRTRIPNFSEYIRENQLNVQKMTLNFYPLPDGTFMDRDTVKEYLLQRGDLAVVSGGYNNLEFTKSGVTKGVALAKLAEYLQVPMESTMAVGDTENDLSILEAAQIGVAMGNAPDDIKESADYVTASNEEDGVAAAIEKFVTI